MLAIKSIPHAERRRGWQPPRLRASHGCELQGLKPGGPTGWHEPRLRADGEKVTAASASIPQAERRLRWHPPRWRASHGSELQGAAPGDPTGWRGPRMRADGLTATPATAATIGTAHVVARDPSERKEGDGAPVWSTDCASPSGAPRDPPPDEARRVGITKLSMWSSCRAGNTRPVASTSHAR